MIERHTEDNIADRPQLFWTCPTFKPCSASVAPKHV